MSLQLFAHPFSSYCQKALIAFYENDLPFELRMLSPEEPTHDAELTRRWPLKRFRMLADGDRTVVEATSIIEYLEVRYPGAVRLISGDPHAAVEVRMLDRIFDNYVATPLQKIVVNALRPPAARDTQGEREARELLEASYAWLNERMTTRTWAAGDAFSLADCAAAPALFYADWTHRIDPRFGALTAYRGRLLARPSFARAVDGGRPYRSFFPLGAPDRD